MTSAVSSSVSRQQSLTSAWLFCVVLYCQTLLLVRVVTSSEFRYLKARRLPAFDDKFLATNVLSTHTADLLASCHRLCTQELMCGSFFFLKSEALCQLHTVLFLDTQETVPRPGARYFQVYDAERCAVDEGYILERSLPLCYKVVATPKTWQNASTFCNQDGARLIEVNSQAVHQHLHDVLRGSKPTREVHQWAGGNKETGTWQWSGGGTIIWTNWAQNEPSNPTAELCLSLAWFFFIKWNDAPCSTSNSFLCQRDLN